MTTNTTQREDVRQKAERLNTLINTMTLFTRRTTLEWVPEILSKTGLTNDQLTVMYELSIEPFQSLKQLSRTIMASASNVSVVIQSMVEDEMVHRITDPADRRRVLLSLSEKGERLFSSAQEHLLDCYQDFLKTLSDSDREALDSAAISTLLVIERILKSSWAEGV